MAVNWDDLLGVADEYGTAILDVIKPFAPALAREGPDLYEGFIAHLFQQDFEAIDRLMYPKMTDDERSKLEAEVLAGAVAAARAKYRRIQLAKDVMFKVLLRVLIMASVG
jgi:hemoglobin-like flavoprotein